MPFTIEVEKQAVRGGEVRRGKAPGNESESPERQGKYARFGANIQMKKR